MLDRFLASDRSFDGRFLTGVVTTGIYCLPSCRARKPRPENVRFFRAEPAARAAGLRPCRRCQPDLFYRDIDPDLELAEGTLARLRAQPSAFADVPALARAAGVGVTRLNELCRRHFHDSAGGLLLREQVAAAARELVDSSRSVLDIALASGFAGSSAFHQNFKALTGMTPLCYRKLATSREFTVALPAGYRIDDTLDNLGRDPEAADVRVCGRRFVKAVHIAGRPVVLECELRRGSARVHVAVPGRLPAGAVPEAHRAALALLGLPLDTAAFERRVLQQPRVRALVEERCGLRMPRAASVFEALCWAIIGQQITLAFAFRLRRAFLELCGERPASGLIAHPLPAAVAALEPADLTACQLSSGKARALIGIARQIAAGELDLEGLAHGSAVRAERTLLGLHGVGPWTAHYVMMRGCGFADCVPVGDAGLGKALQQFFGLEARPDAGETIALMAPFQGHRSVATFHFWRSLGDSP
jgi:AraC family transcriptional regulator of adaptative response / DNA-3-methyladenine glycosylase II